MNARERANDITARDLIGAWRLVSYEVRSESGEVSYPLGRDLVGSLIYTDDGHVAATLMRPGRPAFKAGDILGGTVEEKVGAVNGYVSYCGTFRVESGKVLHRVEMSLFPNWIGTEQERFLSLDGGRLDLRTAPFELQGKRQSAHLIWERDT